MTPSAPDETTDSRALASLTQLCRQSVERPTRSELDQGLNALYARIAAGRVRRRALVQLSLVGLTAALAIMLAVRLGSMSWKHWFAPLPPALTYAIDGGSVLEGGYLRESGRAGVTLRFSEGTTFTLAHGSRGRLRTVDDVGARIAIENGTALFQVTPSSASRWLVEVGPFLVTVKGTVFTVSWDPSSEQFELRLRRGRVVVSGPVTGGELSLQSGQRLVVSLPKAETVISADRASGPLATAADAPTARAAPTASAISVAETEPAGSGPSAPAAALAATSLGARRRWAEALANGRWDRILEDAERDGLDAILNGATSEDLFALANAARYRRRAELARSALLAERRRFPSSSRALDATYLLGRVEETRVGGGARAVAWYDEYLARAPSGTYAAEALGRKMTLINRAGSPTQARAIAEEYLRRFPTGSYAGAARALCEDP